MNFSELSKILTRLSGQNIFVKFNPEILDFSDKTILNDLLIYSGNQEFKVSLTQDSLPIVLSMLKLSIFNKDRKIVVWNWKNFISYVLASTGKLFVCDGVIIDLKIIESYSGLKLKAPKSFNEAFNRIKNIISTGIWKEIESIYKNFHLPLINTVIPHLEVSGVNDIVNNQRVYAYYEIDGQENGRLKCHKAFKCGFVPHAMTQEVKVSLKPRRQDDIFMSFDYQGQEVFMLAWLSKDPLLLTLCQEKDIYVALYEKIFNKQIIDKNDRDLVKKMFLPVIYGQLAYGLSQKCNVELHIAETIISRINTLFPLALAFVEGYQKQVQENGYAKDIFGKRRIFEEGKDYLARNFSVQSPAAVVCLDKLTRLYYALKEKTDLAFSVHDGYVLYATKENWKTIYKIAFDVLSSESAFCPGLRLRVTCRAGRNLDDLKLLARKG